MWTGKRKPLKPGPHPRPPTGRGSASKGKAGCTPGRPWLWGPGKAGAGKNKTQEGAWPASQEGCSLAGVGREAGPQVRRLLLS